MNDTAQAAFQLMLILLAGAVIHLVALAVWLVITLPGRNRTKDV